MLRPGATMPHMPLRKAGEDDVRNSITDLSDKELLERLIPVKIVEAVGGVENIRVVKGDGCEIFPNKRNLLDVKAVHPDSVLHVMLDLSLGDYVDADGNRELVFSHRLQDTRKEPFLYGSLVKFPGQKYPGFPADVNHEFVKNIIGLARDCGYDRVGMHPMWYHIYKMSRCEGFKLDERSESGKAFKVAVERFEQDCKRKAVKTLRERSFEAENQGLLKQIPHMIYDLRQKK